MSEFEFVHVVKSFIFNSIKFVTFKFNIYTWCIKKILDIKGNSMPGIFTDLVVFSNNRIVLIDDALDCLICFSDFIYAFQVQFYFEGKQQVVFIIISIGFRWHFSRY